MKKEMVICDKCKKEFDPSNSVYVTMFVMSNGVASSRCDICEECYRETLNVPIEKEGAE